MSGNAQKMSGNYPRLSGNFSRNIRKCQKMFRIWSGNGRMIRILSKIDKQTKKGEKKTFCICPA